jgi:two-component system alkaline phosphatase synthesis response regulator PhoP
MPEEEQAEVSLGNLTVNFDNFGVYVDDVTVNLSVKEFEVLRVLLQHPNKVLPYSVLLELLWGGPDSRNRRHLSVLMHRLRQKLAGSHPFAIRTIRSRGYGLIREGRASPEIAWRPG